MSRSDAAIRQHVAPTSVRRLIVCGPVALIRGVQGTPPMTAADTARIAITYCSQCQWLLRAAWMAQELLSTSGTDLGEVALLPSTGGIFQVTYNGDLLWDRKQDGGFPDAKILKQRVRDRLGPGRDLGH